MTRRCPCCFGNAIHLGPHANYRPHQHREDPALSARLWFTAQCTCISCVPHSVPTGPQEEGGPTLRTIHQSTWSTPEKEHMDVNCRSILRGHIIPCQNCISKASASYQWGTAQQNIWNWINMANYQGNDNCDSEIWWSTRSNIFFKETCLKIILRAWLRQIAGNWSNTMFKDIFPLKKISHCTTQGLHGHKHKCKNKSE